MMEISCVTIPKNRFERHIENKDLKAVYYSYDDNDGDRRVLLDMGVALRKWREWTVGNRYADKTYYYTYSSDDKRGNKYVTGRGSNYTLYFFEKRQPWFTAKEMETFLYSVEQKTTRDVWENCKSRDGIMSYFEGRVVREFCEGNPWYQQACYCQGLLLLMEASIDRIMSVFSLELEAGV